MEIAVNSKKPEDEVKKKFPDHNLLEDSFFIHILGISSD